MSADIAIITTLDDEFEAVVEELGLNNGEREVKINGWNIICLQLPRRGNIQSAITTKSLLSNNNNLQYIFLVGCAGGIEGREDIELGDVVVSSTVKYYQYQKIDNDTIKFREAEFSTISSSPKVIEKVNSIRDNININGNKILIGEVLSGETIINITSNNNWLNQLLERYDKALAVETEAQGMFQAVYDFIFENNKVIHAAVIKGISDFINGASSNRNKENIERVSKHAAIVTRKLINFLTKDKKPTALIEKYLNYVEDLYHTPNKIDRKPLSDYYVEPKLIKVDIETWNKDEVNYDKIKDDDWSIDKFLSSDDWLTIIGSEFGIGKSSYAKYIANRLAESFKEGNNGYIPIFVNLTYEDNDMNSNIYLSYNLEQILSKLPNDTRYNKILLILDGLDEYNGDINELMNKLRHYERRIALKVLITTRMIDTYPKILKINEYVRIKPFDKEQADEFFKKYEVNLTYEYLKDTLGLSDDEILKPLFAWIIAYMHKESDGLRKIDVSKLDLEDNNVKYMIVRTILYHNFISVLVRGKHRNENETLDELKASYIAEKELLRVLSAINNIYGKIEGDINKLIEPFNINYNNINKALDYIIESYFYTSIQDLYKPTKVYQFIHKSMQEYLLAEYLYENIKNNNIHRLAIGLPSKECMYFLYGLISILKYYDKVKDMLDYPEDLEPLVNRDDINKIINNCKSIIKDDKIILYDTENKDGFTIPKDNNANRYSKLYIHRWVAVNILSWLSNEKDRKLADVKEDLIALIRETSHNIMIYLKYLEYSLLSGAKLSGAILYRAILSEAKLSGAKLSGADLSGADLSGAILSGAKLFGAILYRAILSEAILSGADLSGADITRAKLFGAILSGAKLSGADLSNVIFYLFSWEDKDILNSNLANYLKLYGINIQEYKLTRNNNKITLTKGDNKITIELKDNKVILTINNDELGLVSDVIKEDNKTKIFIPIVVDKFTNTKGIILTDSNDKKSIKEALSNLHPNLRDIVLRDNPNYKEIWK